MSEFRYSVNCAILQVNSRMLTIWGVIGSYSVQKLRKYGLNSEIQCQKHLSHLFRTGSETVRSAIDVSNVQLCTAESNGINRYASKLLANTLNYIELYDQFIYTRTWSRAREPYQTRQSLWHSIWSRWSGAVEAARSKITNAAVNNRKAKIKMLVNIYV